MRIITILFLAMFIIDQSTYAQVKRSTYEQNQKSKPLNYVDKKRTNEASMLNIGIGMGLTYGGIGGRLVLNPLDQLGLFFGLGYNIHNTGINLGAIYYVQSPVKTQLYLSGMYGYNAVIVYGKEKNEYNGPSFGIGLKINSKSKTGSYFDIGLIVPVRSDDFHSDIDKLSKNPNFDVKKPWPVLINIGYNFRLY